VRSLSDAQEVLADAADRFERIAVACSFQKEATVILDLVAELGADRFDVFTLDTGVLFEETREAWKHSQEHFGIEIAGVRGDWPERLWETNPDACCEARKVVPLRDRLKGYDAWVTGVRREQSDTRAGTPHVGWDAKHGLHKIAPLAAWTEREVWNHIVERGLPYHSLHDQGYASIGCAPCTLPGDGRDGRWAGTDKLECGLHVPGDVVLSPPLATDAARN
jgi:phosphoadenosine phosphosulfate reductase